MSKKTLIRCGEKNNFNFTAAEIEQLKGFADSGKIFVNSNSFVNITADFPSIITINPYLKAFIEPKGDLANVKACRIKWVCRAKQQVLDAQTEAIQWSISMGIPVLITFMRFKSYTSIQEFVTGSEDYVFNAGWLRPIMRLRSEALEKISTIASDYGRRNVDDLIYTCDMSGHGCPSCNNCKNLIVGEENADDYEIKSLNLSTSGDYGRCIFNCPDCWAKNILKIVKNQRPKCNVLFANRKQKGELAHE